MDNKDKMFLACLRQNARSNLTSISKKTGIPISTLYDRLKLNEQGVILKHTTLVDFTKLGFGCRANIILKTNRDERDEVRQHLSKHENINALYKINNGYDFMIDAVFNNLKEMEDFIEDLEMRHRIEEKKVHYIIEELVRENFLTNTALI